ncbi:MAG: AMP-binding protein [Kiloniellaceae bacterium]
MAIEATSLDRERDQQRRWRLRPRFANETIFDELVHNEFRDPAEVLQGQAAAVDRIMLFASGNVPHYQALFEKLGLQPRTGGGLAQLRLLPVLSKFDVLNNEKALCATALPANEKIHSWFYSSGTTGRTVRVLHTRRSNLYFNYIAQRQFRWFRWDPQGTRAEIRTYSLLPPQPDGRKQRPGAACRHEAWRFAGHFFETGPQVGLCVTNPVKRQLDWLLEVKPDYLTANASVIDRLAWFAEARNVPASLSGIHAISEQMTAPMRQRVARCFGATVDENYGLNEIGIVALRCAAGRYHVNSEHCLVEILDEDGQLCPPGSVGRVVITGLNNFAMPMLRYESGDLAMAVTGECRCGRSLPAFGELVGRYRRLAGLPDDTLSKIIAIKFAIRDVPVDVGDRLREYQIHQRLDQSYDLLIHVEGGPLPKEYTDWFQENWHEQFGQDAPKLKLLEVDEIPSSPSGKPLEFVSEFAPQ